MKDQLGSFIAEAESGTKYQVTAPAKMRYEKMCDEAQLDIDKEVLPPPVAIYIDDSPACTFGNFSASIGKPKGKKTFNVSAMTAAAMTNSTILNYRAICLRTRTASSISTPNKAPTMLSGFSSVLPH